MNTKYKMKKLQIALLVLAANMFSGCLAPDNAYLMELNRNGKWLVAEKTGLKMQPGICPVARRVLDFLPDLAANDDCRE